MLCPCHIVPPLMAAASIPIAALGHKGKVHRQLAVDQVFQNSRHIKVIQWKGPHNQIRP